MEQTYYSIIIGALLFEYALSTVSALLNMKSITSDIPEDFKNHYDEEKYSQSQSYLKDKTKFGLFSGTFSLTLTLLVIHTGIFGYIDTMARSFSDNSVVHGLVFFGIIFLVT